jgi:hypothetical protein
MEIVITAWALDSYLELKHHHSITRGDYQGILRPDVLLLKKYPDDPQFANGKFWSPVSSAGVMVRGGFKMKWHNLGAKRLQLRLPVGLLDEAFLFQAYAKTDPKAEARQLIKFKVRLDMVRQGNFTECGRLS